MVVEDVGQLPQVEDVAELQRLLAAAQRSAEVSRCRANNEATKAGRWRDARDEFAAAARAALGMGPPTPHFVHTTPIVERIGEVVAERDAAREELQVRVIAEAKARIIAVAEARAEAEAATDRAVKAERETEEVRRSIRAERKSIAARESAVERRVEKVRAEADAAVEKGAKTLARLAEKLEAAEKRADAADLALAVLRADRATRDAERKERVALTQAGARIAALQGEVEREKASTKAAERAERAARRELERLQVAPVVEPKRAAAGSAPRQPLIDLLKSGPPAIRRHGARLERWAEGGSGPALEAARSMAAALECGEVAGEARLKALTGLAGLLGGV